MTGARSFVLCSALAALGACTRGGAAGGRSAEDDGAAAGGGGGAGAAGSDAADATPEDAVATIDGADSTVILTVTPNDGEPITGISNLVVTVQQDGADRVVTFAHAPLQPIVAPAGIELSLGVTAPESGQAIFSVEARAASGCTAAKGLATVSIAFGTTTHAAVELARLDACADSDAGAAEAGEAGSLDGPVPFPGCDPVTPDCPDGMLCQVACATHTAACTPAGSGFHGTACASDVDCAPGTQCFDYSAAGCVVKICRHFCATEANCPQPIQLTLPRNVCTQPLSCSELASAYQTCTVSCDPTSGATANGSTGCEDGLACVLQDANHADCTCPPRTRTKTEGAACATADDCAPGLVCDVAGATGTCRAVCHCYADSGSCTSTDDDCPTVGTRCSPFAEGGVFGVCRT